jgi:hypothetical protein
MIHSSMPLAGLRRFALHGVAIALFMVCAAQPGRAAYLTLGQLDPVGSDNFSTNLYLAPPGQDLTLAVTFVNDSPTDTLDIGGADIGIQWDPTIFTFVSSTLGNLSTTFAGGLNVNTNDPGSLYFNPYGGSQTLGPNASGTFLTFTLHTATTAPGGIYNVNLVFANPNDIPTGVTDFLGFNILLNPNPTDGYDPMVDALVAVPEPGSLVLMGLGLSTTCLFGLRRRLRRS